MTDITTLVGSVDMYELACKANHNIALSADEKDLTSELDARFKEIGKAGHDADHEIAQFIRKTVNEDIYNAPNELLDAMFEQSSIGEFDDFEGDIRPVKNTLVAHEAARGGNVERSYLDIAVLQPKWKNFQIEFDISFADVERNGWKTIALYTEYAEAAFRNKQFKVIFDDVDAAIQAGAINYIAETTSNPTAASMDAMALYLNDRAEGNGMIVGLSKYIQAASKLNNNSFISQAMIDEIHRNGRLGEYDGCAMYPISSAKKLGNGDLLIKDKRLFGIAGRVGTLVQKGEMRTYQDQNNQKECFHIMLKDFTFGYAWNETSLENLCKMVIA